MMHAFLLLFGLVMIAVSVVLLCGVFGPLLSISIALNAGCIAVNIATIILNYRMLRRWP